MELKKMKQHVVIFVEGETDKIFFDALLHYYRAASKVEIASCEVRNLKGVSRYTSKVLGKLENEIQPMARSKGMEVKAVCCSYDTDVFEFAERPVVDWSRVEREVKRLGIEMFCRIEVKSMIEDWLLDDLAGLCAFLKLKQIPNSLQGNNANARIQFLFRKANKNYLKGNRIAEFISFLDMAKIRNQRKASLRGLEDALGVRIE
jgi:hypothetical protein